MKKRTMLFTRLCLWLVISENGLILLKTLHNSPARSFEHRVVARSRVGLITQRYANDSMQFCNSLLSREEEKRPYFQQSPKVTL